MLKEEIYSRLLKILIGFNQVELTSSKGNEYTYSITASDSDDQTYTLLKKIDFKKQKNIVVIKEIKVKEESNKLISIEGKWNKTNTLSGEKYIDYYLNENDSISILKNTFNFKVISFDKKCGKILLSI